METSIRGAARGFSLQSASYIQMLSPAGCQAQDRAGTSCGTYSEQALVCLCGQDHGAEVEIPMKVSVHISYQGLMTLNRHGSVTGHIRKSSSLLLAGRRESVGGWGGGLLPVYAFTSIQVSLPKSAVTIPAQVVLAFCGHLGKEGSTPFLHLNRTPPSIQRDIMAQCFRVSLDVQQSQVY